MDPTHYIETEINYQRELEASIRAQVSSGQTHTPELLELAGDCCDRRIQLLGLLVSLSGRLELEEQYIDSSGELPKG